MKKKGNIKKIEILDNYKEEFIYDITIKDNHNYFANKILVHNCRMIAILKNGKCTLWSRTRKPITSLPHIVAEIEANFVDDTVLDGEAYNHAFKTNFEHATWNRHRFSRCNRLF